MKYIYILAMIIISSLAQAQENVEKEHLWLCDSKLSYLEGQLFEKGKQYQVIKDEPGGLIFRNTGKQLEKLTALRIEQYKIQKAISARIQEILKEKNTDYGDYDKLLTQLEMQSQYLHIWYMINSQPVDAPFWVDKTPIKTEIHMIASNLYQVQTWISRFLYVLLKYSNE